MTTYSALTTLPGEELATKLADALEALTPEPTGVGVFEVEDGVVSEVPDTDWVAHVRRELAPVVAGRFFVYGAHDADKVPDDCTPLLIEAAMAFGTGHHGTTLGCLRAFDRLVTAGFTAGKVADIGCGTAVLAMAAATVVPEVVIASDIDPVAVDVARVNVTANNLDGQVMCVTAAGFETPALKEAAPYDLIFANILKGPLIGLSADMALATDTVFCIAT